MSDQQYISKGFYLHKQPSELISVQNYIYVRSEGKKCLLLRLSNDLGYTVDEIDLTVIQLDASGKIVAKSRVKYSQMKLGAGETFVTERGIVVDEFCTDFRVVFSSVKSGRYKYTVRGGNILSVRYLKRPTALEHGLRNGEPLTEHKIRSVNFGSPRLMVLAALIALIVLMGANALSVFSDISNRDETVEIMDSETDQ